MFTGMIEDIGIIEKVVKKDSGLAIVIGSQKLFEKPFLGGSTAINGVRLTQSYWEKGLSTFDVVDETLHKTNLGLLLVGDLVNLERPMEVGARIEGHFVQGHVDGVGHLHQIDLERNEIWVEVPGSLQHYFIPKGSIALDGVSLTIASTQESLIRIALIPHTLEKTIFRSKEVGEPINLEVDLFGKYACKYLENHIANTSEAL